MATMIPRVMEEDNNSFGERQVFEALMKLPPEYTVFHSVRWNMRNEKNRVVWGESDFTILHQKKGMLVIEVKSGGIECFNNQWTYVRTDNFERYTMKNPMKQADKSKYKFLEIMDELFEDRPAHLEPQYCYVESAVWFPSISKRDIIGELPMEFEPEITLYENALSNPQAYIDGIYEYYESFKRTRLNDDSYQKIVNAMAPHYSVVPSLKSKRQEQDEMFVRLTREQNSLLDYLQEQRVAAIQGAAGTGKTMLAIEKAKRLAESGKVLFLCFNQFLKQYLQGLKEESPKEYANIDFDNLPRLACSKIGVPSVEKEDIHQFLNNYENYNWEYKHIVIDEGQDFVEDKIDKLYDISLHQGGAFYIFYDKNQFVQGREFPEWLMNAECRLVLNINCRNTYSIADTSGKAIHVEPKVKNKSVRGDMPQFHICAEQNDALKKLSVLIDRYRNNGDQYEQICILTIKTEALSLLNGVERVGKHTIASTRGKNNVLFTTARKFKGLESNTIILVDVDADTFNDEENKRLFYVGASRAKHSLDIVFVGDDAALSELDDSLSDNKAPNPIIGVARSLNVKPMKA